MLSITIKKKIFGIVAGKKKKNLKKSEKKKSAFTVAFVPQKEKDLDIFPGVNEQMQQL